MNSSGFSHTSLDARIVASMAQEQISISREKYHAERKEYIDYHYYRKYVRWGEFFNRVRRFFGFKPKTLVDSDTYYQEFDDGVLSLAEAMILATVGYEHRFRIEELKAILPLAEAAILHDGIVKLTSEACNLLGYGKTLVPITPEEQERSRAEQELAEAVTEALRM